jgi:hypothetical protein
MRTGIDGLSQRIQNTLGRSPCDGSAYAFHNHRRTRIKLLVWDGTGVWLCHRRLHRGHFIWPRSDATTCTVASTCRIPAHMHCVTRWHVAWLRMAVRSRRLPTYCAIARNQRR